VTTWVSGDSAERFQGKSSSIRLIGTAKLNDLNRETYLRDVLSRITDHPIKL